MLIVVVLPEPLGPMSPRISPSTTRRERRSTAVKPPNRFVSPRVSRMTPLMVGRDCLTACDTFSAQDGAGTEERAHDGNDDAPAAPHADLGERAPDRLPGAGHRAEAREDRRAH